MPNTNKKTAYNIYWIGPRLSDIQGLEYLFKGAIVIFGEKYDNIDFYCNPFSCSFDIRINHNDNKYDDYIDNHFAKEFETIIKNDPHAQFLWYRGLPFPDCGEDIKRRSICYNPSLLIDLLSDKLRSRLLFSNYIPVAGTKLMFGTDCTYNNLSILFPEYDEFILQEPIGSSGGFATHILSSKNERALLQAIKYKDLLVSPYYKENIPINHHLVIYPNEILIFPPSIQLIERVNDKLQYCGGDFVAAQELSPDMQKEIYTQGKKIGATLQKMGYRGVLGIDYLILPDNRILFLEINTRFQASTIALNQALSDNRLPSIHEYHIESFSQNHPSKTCEITNVDYSIVSFLHSEANNAFDSKDQFLNDSENKVEFLSDGLLVNQKLDNNAFLYRLLIKSNVSSIFGKRVSHHPNIFSQKIHLTEDKDSENLTKLKIGLLVHGIRIEDKGFDAPIKKAVGSAFDLVIDDKLFINTFVNIKYASLSPFLLQWIEENKFKLLYNGKFITNVKIDYADKYASLKTKNGIDFYSVAQFFTDRLRIHPFSSCIYGRNKNNACKFCDLGNCIQTPIEYELEDIFEVIEFYISSNLPIRHFLIGGGTSLGEKSWKRIIDITKHIRSLTNREIYLMSIPPSNDVLDKLHEAGVSEVGFNIEIFDRIQAKSLMPQKGQINIEEYYNAFQYSTSLWKKEGNVRSLLMVGLEPVENTLRGVEELCKRGVMPILSLFRPIPNTPMENMTPLNYTEVFEIWEKASLICQKYGLILGPKCIPCQNNTLSFSVDY